MRLRILAAATAIALAAGLCGCGGAKRGFEFLAMPRAGLRVGSRWKPGVGPIGAGPAEGVKISRRSRGVDWLRRETARSRTGSLQAALTGFFAVGLGLETRHIHSVEAVGLSHRRVLDAEDLTRGYSYLWETIEADRVRVRLDRSVVGSLEAKVNEMRASDAGRKMKLAFWPVAGASREVFEVTGRNLVVAVRVVSFDVGTESGKMTLKLGRENQGKDQPGPLGYRICVASGDVAAMARRFKVLVRNPQFADSEKGEWERTLASKSTKIYAGPVIGKKYDMAVDRAYVSGWNFDGMTCEVVFQRSTWRLKQTESGLETAK
jgi:hypothetical protein